MLKKILVVVSGTVAAQAVGVALMPLLSRMYSPEEFGVYAIYVAIVSPLVAIGALRYDSAIPMVGAKRSGQAIVKLAILLLAGLFFVASLVLGVGYVFSQYIGLSGLPDALIVLLIPVGIVLMALFQVGTYCAAGKGHYGKLARTRAEQGVSGALLQTFLGIFGFGGVGLVGGHLAGYLVGAIGFAREYRFGAALRVGCVRVRVVAKRYRNFPLYEAPQTLLNAASLAAVQLLLGAFFGAQVSGLYLLAQKVVGVPLGLIGNSFRQVFYAAAVKASADRRLYVLVRNSTIGLALSSLVVVGVILLSSNYFGLIFGEQWAGAGLYAAYIAGWAAMGVVNVPVNVALPIRGWQRHALRFEVVYGVARVIVLYFFCQRGDPHDAVLAIGSVGVAFNLVLIVWVANRLRREDLSPC